MITIKRSRNYPYYWINGELPQDVLLALQEELSYYHADYMYSEKYQRGEWDGKVHLLRRTKKGDLYFPIGLIDRVKSVLDAFGLQYEVLDSKRHDYGHLGLVWAGPDLRDYQKEAVMKALQEGSGVISLPTGAGKTLIGLRLMYSLDCSTLITVHTKELFYQWQRKIEQVLDYTPGLVGDGFKKFKPITVAMMQTITKMDIPRFTMLLIDECHHAPCDTLFRVAMRCNAMYRYGLSATPRREDGADLKIWASIGEICVNISPEQLIDMGYLAKPRFIILDPPAKRLPRYSWQKAYDEGIVRHEERNQMIIDIVKKLVKKGLQVYVHVVRIAHGTLLASRIGCPFLSGKDPTHKRQQILEDFENGKLRVLVSTLLGEGVDLPAIDAIVMAHGQKTSIGTIQKIGRALRVRPDKQEAIIVDFADKGPFLAKHFEQRYATERSYYGKYFKPIWIRDLYDLKKGNREDVLGRGKIDTKNSKRIRRE